MHTGPVPGDFTEDKKKSDARCHKCGRQDVWVQKWESSCGGYEDYKYRCQSCNEVWWIEGSDS